MTCYCGHGDETSGYIKVENVLTAKMDVTEIWCEGVDWKSNEEIL
jgi:hypothetical protein